MVKGTRYSWHKMSIQNCTKYCTIEQSCAKQQNVSEADPVQSACADEATNLSETYFLNNDIYGVGFRVAASYKSGHSLMKTKHGLDLYICFFNKLRYCYFFFVWLWEVWVLTGKRWRGDAGPCHPHSLSSECFFLILLILGWGLLAHVAEVRVRIGFRGQRLLAAATGRQQFSFLGVPPLHPPVLEPDFHL